MLQTDYRPVGENRKNQLKAIYHVSSDFQYNCLHSQSHPLDYVWNSIGAVVIMLVIK